MAGLPSSWLPSLLFPFQTLLQPRLDARPSPETCHYNHDASSMYLSLLVTVGLLVSYLPQHYRIIVSKSSEGISPWFMLLGATSSASSLANVVTLQWGVVRCCRFLTPGNCAESMLGIVQVGLQWLCFNIVLALFLIYYPSSKKYVLAVPVDLTDPLSAHHHHAQTGFNKLTRASSHFLSRFFSRTTHAAKRAPKRARAASSAASSVSSRSSGSSFDPQSVLPPSATRAAPLILSPEYSLSIVLACVVLLHFLLSACITIGLLLALPKASSTEPTTPPPDAGEHPSIRVLRFWASFSGLFSMALACFQYVPQIFKTARSRLVGSLSVPMMVIQTPGSFVFVYSLAVRPGVNWTTWATYLVTGILQGILLCLCIAWKFRQSAMGIDDWGNDKPHLRVSSSSEPRASEDGEEYLVGVGGGERRPLLGSVGRERRVRRGEGSGSAGGSVDGNRGGTGTR